MQNSIINFALIATFLVVFVGRTLALEIALGASSFPPSQFLAVPDQSLQSDCQTDCAPAKQAIQTCGDTDDNCLCNDATVKAIQTCEQCMFSDLIHNFKTVSDPRGNPSAALTAYAAACSKSVNTTLSVAVALPTDWSGPVGVGLGLPATIIAVIFTACFGSGLIYILNTM